jgi:hypothetical protein
LPAAIAGDPPKLAISATTIASDLQMAAMTRSDASGDGGAPQRKGDAVEATAAAGLHSNLGDAGGAIPAASAESVASKVSPARHNEFLVVDLSRG